MSTYKKLFINPRLDDAMFNISYAYAQVKTIWSGDVFEKY